MPVPDSSPPPPTKLGTSERTQDVLARLSFVGRWLANVGGERFLLQLLAVVWHNPRATRLGHGKIILFYGT